MVKVALLLIICFANHGLAFVPPSSQGGGEHPSFGGPSTSTRLLTPPDDLGAVTTRRNHAVRPLYSSMEAEFLSSPALDDSLLWGLRITSALLSYIGLVTILDRPRGQMLVDPAVDVVVQPSTVPGAGLGLFAKRDLPRGTALGTYPGVLLKITEPNLSKVRDYPHCETYIWRFTDSQFVLDPTNAEGNLQDAVSGGSPASPGSYSILKLTGALFPTVTTLLCRINEPPLGKDVNVVTEESLERRTVTFLLERDVYEGEEFFIDYGLTYDRSRYGPSDP